VILEFKPRNPTVVTYVKGCSYEILRDLKLMVENWVLLDEFYKASNALL
jgi:hypothetical protein